MANKLKGEVDLEAGGKNYALVYTHDALIELEDQLDRGIVAILKEIQEWSKDPDKIRLGMVRSLLWAGLRKHHPEIDLIAAGELIADAGGIGKVMTVVGEGMRRSFESSETKDPRPTKKQRRNGIGADSSQNISHSDMPSVISGS